LLKAGIALSFNKLTMVSAIILSYNRASEVLFTIDRLKEYRAGLPFDLEIVVVDNASVDGTSLLVKEQHPDVTLVSKVENNGIAGWNEGFKVAKHKYFLVLDDDSHIYSGLTEAVARLESQPDIGILALLVKDKDLKDDPHLDPDEAWKDNDEIVGFIGCGAIIRKELYDKIGGFAEWIHVYTHEFEYAIRCLDAGYRVNFFGNAIVIHRVSNINRSNKRIRIFATRNELLIVNKYFGKNRFKFLFRVLVNNLKFIKREGLLAGYYILQGYFKFLRYKNKIGYTPVSDKTQQNFANNFWSTKPIINKRNK
jgi:GT2 family glycosyltransferase